MKPKRLTDRESRRMARCTRDHHWSIMERIRDTPGGLWICLWNKYGRDEAPNEVRMCLISGMEWAEWVMAHRDWFRWGRYNTRHDGNRYRLTDAGLAALEDRAPYDMEPVEGGLVEPGWICTPLPPTKERL